MTQTQPDGYLAQPTSGRGDGVLVLHAWWGLNDTIRAFCDRLAEEGFVAFAPDLYHGKVADTIEGAEALAGALEQDFQKARDEVAGAAAFLDEQAGRAPGGIAVVGFSLGAFYALDLSATRPERIRSVVTFYGSGGEEFSASRAGYLLHFAEDDPYEPADNVAWVEGALRAAGRPVTVHTYPGTGHWFFEPDRADAYNAAAAGLAWERTLAFLRQ
jgi:carboxymethylenebutenolidase